MTCTCYGPGELLGAGDMAQQRALYAASRKNCRDHAPCLIVDCTRPRAEGVLCGPCAYYFRVILANPFYRNHECPEMQQDGSVQKPLIEVGR